MRALSTWPSCQRAETFECMHETDCLRPVCNAVSVRPQNIVFLYIDTGGGVLQRHNGTDQCLAYNGTDQCLALFDDASKV